MTGPGRALRFYAVGAMVCAMALADSRTATRQTHLKNLERLLEQAAHHGQTGNGSTSVQHTNSSIKALEDIRAEVIAMLALQPQGHGHDQGQDHAAPGASTAVLSAAALDNAATVNTPDVIDRGKVKSTNATCTRLQILTCATYNSGEWKTWHDALSIETQARIAAARRTKQSAAQSAQPQYLPPLNLCLGKKWGGWGWKLQQLADWVTELNLKQDTLDAAARARACTIVVLYVDGKDVFVNRHVSHGEAVARWKKIGTDIVISTEMVCYTGDYCHDRDILKYYSHLVPGNVATPSTYCNSAVMGTTVALASVIPALIESYTAFRNGKKFNDQARAPQPHTCTCGLAFVCATCHALL